MSLFSDLKPKANLNLNPFDRSRSETFSTKLGTITPVFVEHTIPKGKYKINFSDIVRPSTMAKANFSSLNQNIEFWFVPYSQLWRWFNDMYYQRGEEMRSLNVAFSNTHVIPPSVPEYPLGPVVRDVCLACCYWELFDAKRRAYEAEYFDSNDHDISPLENWALGHRLLLSNGVDYHETNFIDVHGRFCGYDMLRVVDMLGYGNYIPFVNNVWSIFTRNNPTFSDSDIAVATLQDLSSALDTIFDVEVEDVLTDSLSVNAFAIMAYNKVFNDVYKNKEYDTYNYAYLFNADWHKTGGVAWDANQYWTYNMIKPYYRLYKRDLFTGLYPNSQFGNVALAGLENPSTIFASNPPSTIQNAQVRGSNTSSPGALIYANSTENSWIVNSSISALSIRQAEALQRWKEKIIRAGRKEEDLQRAIFGVSSKYIEDQYVDYVGSYESPIAINPVEATAETNDVNIGDLGASSVGSIAMGSQKEIEFEAYDFGIILGVMYILPEAKYDAFGVDPQNIKFVSDQYFKPEFQNLGMEAVPSYLNDFVIGNTDASKVLGYLSRYYEYKTAISKVHGEFYGSNPWQPDSDAGYYQQLNFPVSAGGFSDYVSTRNFYDVSAGNLRMLYVAPWDADRLFVQADRPSPKFDHFIIESSFRVKAVLPMSVVGLPY